MVGVTVSGLSMISGLEIGECDGDGVLFNGGVITGEIIVSS